MLLSWALIWIFPGRRSENDFYFESELKAKIRAQAEANGNSMEDEIRCIQNSALNKNLSEPAQSPENIPLTLSLEERLFELEKRGLWKRVKTPRKPLTLGEPTTGALEQFLAER